MDKHRERATVKAFLAWQGYPISCLIEWDRERPDAIIRVADDRIGVEVTALTEVTRRQSTPPQQWVAEATRIVRAAQTAFEQRQSAALNVRLELRPAWCPGATKAQTLADEFASMIEKALVKPRPFSRPDEAITLREPHPELTWAYIDRSKLGGHWAPSFAHNIQRASIDDIRSTVERKEKEIAAYRSAAPSIWLLIDCNLSGQGLALDVPEPLRITSGFDRVFCCGFGMWKWVEVLTDQTIGMAG
jgi:hypothetical protein